MTRRCVVLLGSVAVVAALAGMAWLLQHQHAAVTHENIHKIVHNRLNRAQIEELIGPGQGDEKRGVWVGEHIILAIDFAPDSNFTRVDIDESLPEPLMSRVRRWLHL
jgi:hypothetical protein